VIDDGTPILLVAFASLAVTLVVFVVQWVRMRRRDRDED
jgi:hypothetical protein